jgi:di/tricarboxylate transporter
VLHSFDTSSTTIAAVALMFLPGIGIMTWKDAQPRIPWGTIVLFGIGISVGTALLQTKGASWLADLAVVQFGLKNATALFVLAVLSLFLTLIHLGFASATALASAMIPIVIAVLQGVATPGINIVGMTMLLQFVVSFGFILVVNAPQNMVAYGTETFDAKDFMRTGLVLTVIAGLGHAAWRNLLALARLRLSETARERIANGSYDFQPGIQRLDWPSLSLQGCCKTYQMQGTRTGGERCLGGLLVL